LSKFEKNLTSIILPVWLPSKDKEKYIKWTLDSLCETTDKNFELIIVNNETKDSDKIFIKKNIKQFSNNKFCKKVRVIYNKKNEGWTGAINEGIEASQGEFVNWTNDDLIFERNWLSKMLKHFKEDVACVGPISNFTSGIQDIKFSKPGVYEERVNYLIGFCMLFRRKALDSIYDGHYIDPQFFPGGSDELDVCLRLRKAGWDLILARDVFISHFGNRSLEHLPEFQKNQNEFYKKRLNLLIVKHGQEAVEAMMNYQKCPKFVIGIPTIGKIDYVSFSCYPWMLQRAWKEFGFDQVIPMISPRNLPHIARNEIVKKAILYGAEYLMFLDDDMVYPEDVLIRLYNHQKDYVSALAYQRLEPFNPCIYKDKDSDGKLIPHLALKEGLVEVDATGLSCALIKMSAIKKVIKNVVAKRKEIPGLFRFTRFGEDLNFGMDLRKVGIKLYADTDLTIDHLGNEMRINYQTHISYNKNKLQLIK